MSTAHENRVERNRVNAKAKTRFSQDIWFQFAEILLAGPQNPDRRREACGSLRAFCEAYAPDDFSLAWSGPHLTAIEKIEAAVLRGKKFAFAMPRGSGKSTLCHWSVLWATLNGHSRYAVLINATNQMTSRRLENFKRSLFTNELIAADYPEILLSIKHIDNSSIAARSQRFAGEPTFAEWTSKRIVYPFYPFSVETLPREYPKSGETVEVSDSDVQRLFRAYEGLGIGLGAVVDIASIEGEIRGRNYTPPTGGVIRPDLVIVDDPQTAESAKSVSQVEDRERKLSSDIKFLEGPGASMGLVIPCTVIYEGDLADRLLDRKIHPEYRGEKSVMVEAWPDGFLDDPDSPVRRLWDQWRSIRLEDLEAGGEGDTADEFYIENREAMDEGFRVSWPARFQRGEVSAIQHALTRWYEDEASFWSEYQNDPGAVASAVSRITPDDILNNTHVQKRGVIPDDADALVAFVDISEACFWYVIVAAKRSTFRSYVVDFGSYPDQQMSYYTLKTLRHTLQKRHPGKVFDDILSVELEALFAELATRTYKREDGSEVYIDAIGVDSSWGEYTNNVYQICHRSPHRNLLHASKGVGITPRVRPLVDPEQKRKKGVLESPLGQWKVTRTKLRTPLLQYDTNFWKSRKASFWLANDGLSVFKADRRTLQVYADQETAETCEREISRDRELDVWTQRPGVDNHFGDCTAGSLVLLHKLGARLKLPAVKKKTKESRAHKKTREAGKTTSARGYRVEF